MNSKRVSAALFAALLAAPLAAQDAGGLIPTPNQPPTRQGTRGANFLEIGVGARAAAMAGAAAGLVQGPEAWYWNAAGGASTDQFTVAASKQDLYSDLDIRHNFVGVALPVGGGVIGLHFINLTSGDIERTTEQSPSGGDPLLGSTYRWSSMSIGVSYARRITDRLDIGATVKHVSEGIEDATIGWAALDVGTQFRTGLYGLSVGASLLNVGPSARARGPLIQRKINTDQFAPERTSVEFSTEDTELPTMFRFSVGSDLLGRASSLLGGGAGTGTLDAEVAFSKAIDSDIQMGVGLEYGFRDILFLRGGKRFYNDGRIFGSSSARYGLSGGLGLRLPIAKHAFRFDYAYTSLGELQNVQVLSLSFGR